MNTKKIYQLVARPFARRVFSSEAEVRSVPENAEALELRFLVSFLRIHLTFLRLTG